MQAKINAIKNLLRIVEQAQADVEQSNDTLLQRTLLLHNLKRVNAKFSIAIDVPPTNPFSQKFKM